MPYYGPLAYGQNRYQLGQQQRRANQMNAAYRVFRAGHQYARRNNLYQRAYQGLSKWAKGYTQSSKKRYSKAYAKQASMDKWGTPMQRNTIKPLKAKFPSNTRRVNFIGKGKKRKALVNIPRVLTTHPHTVRQTVYFSKNTLDAGTKSITSLQPCELYPSLNQQYLTGMVFTLTKTWWGTNTIDGTNKARIGNQVVPPIQSDLYLSTSNNTVASLNKRPTMLTLNNLPEQPNGLVPNNHFVSGFNLHLDIQSLVPGAQLCCVQIVRRSFQQDPVANGAISTADFQEMTNDIKVVDKDKFQTIYQKLIHLPALTPGQTHKHYKVKKFVKCMLKRNTLRKTSSIASLNVLSGAQVKPHYEFSTGGEMYNQCFLVVKAKRYTNTANVTSRKTGTGTTPGSSNLPDKWDEMTPAKCVLTGQDVGQTISFGGYTEPQIATTGENGIYSGACIRLRGSVSTYFRVREILNQDVDNTVDVTPAEEWPEENLENINVVDEYHSDEEPHEHYMSSHGHGNDDDPHWHTDGTLDANHEDQPHPEGTAEHHHDSPIPFESEPL